MGREVRMVAAAWQHPKTEKLNYRLGVTEERYQPMFDEPFGPAMKAWYEAWQAWERGERPDHCDEESREIPYWEWEGGPPDPKYYRPDWPQEARTHFMMYENTSEGTPISPAFATPEELARWLTDNQASAFGGMTATYEQWLAIAKGGWAPSMVVPGNTMMSGVEAMTPPNALLQQEEE